MPNDKPTDVNKIAFSTPDGSEVPEEAQVALKNIIPTLEGMPFKDRIACLIGLTGFFLFNECVEDKDEEYSTLDTGKLGMLFGSVCATLQKSLATRVDLLEDGHDEHKDHDHGKSDDQPAPVVKH